LHILVTLTLKHTKQSARCFDQFCFAACAQDDRWRMASASHGGVTGTGIDDAVHRGCKARGSALVRDHVRIDARQRLAGWNDSIGSVANFFRWQSTANHHRQQGGRNAVADCIGDEYSDVSFVEPNHVINIPGNVTRWPPESVGAYVAHLGERAR